MQKAKAIVWRCKSGCFALQYRRFCRAKQVLLERKSAYIVTHW